MGTIMVGFIDRIKVPYWLFLLVLISMGSSTFVDDFYHKPIQSHPSNKDIIIAISSLGNERPVAGTLYYRSKEMQHYLEIPMVYENTEWFGIIPAVQLISSFIEYAIILEMDDTDLYAFPREDPFKNPYKIMILQDDGKRLFKTSGFDEGNLKTVNMDMMILSPEPGEVLSADQVVVAVSFFGVDDIDYNTIHISIDDVDYTEKAEISTGLFSLVPGKLKSGKHKISVAAKNIHGLEIMPEHWSFTVAKHGFDIAEKIVYNGSISMLTSKENIDDNILNISEIRGQINGGVNWIHTQSNFRFTSRESPYSQALNRLSTTFKMSDYLTIYTGDFYPNLSSYLIAGKRVRGLGVSVTFSWLNLDIISGELNRSVQWKGKTDQGYTLNSLYTTVNHGGSHTYYLDRTGYTFTRSIDTYRLSANYKSKMFFGLYFLKSKDDPHSVFKNISSKATITVDSMATGLTPGVYTLEELETSVSEANGILHFSESNWGGGDPEDNLVIGFDTKAYFDQRQLSTEFSWNMSLYNRNIWDGAITRTELDTTLDDSLDGLIGTQYDEYGLIVGTPLMIDTTLIFDPTSFEKIFTINQYMTPLFFYDVMTFNEHPIATLVNMPSAAFHLRINGRYPGNTFYVEYRQVGPQYISFGNPYLTTNIREFSISDQIALLDYKLIFNLGYQYQDNDILKTEVDPLRTQIFSSNIMLNPGPNVPSFTMSLQSIKRSKEIKEFDELLDLRENSVTSNAMFSVNVPFTLKQMKSIFNVNYNSVVNTDLLAEERMDGYIFPKTNTNIISVNLMNTVSQNLRLKFAGYQATIHIPSYTTSDMLSEFNRLSLSAEVHYLTMNNKVRYLGYIASITNSGLTTINMFNGRIGCEVDIWKNILIRIAGSLQLYEYLEAEMEDPSLDETEKPPASSYELNTTGLQLSIHYKF